MVNSTIIHAVAGVLLFLSARFLIFNGIDFYGYIKNKICPENPFIIFSDGLVIYSHNSYREQEIRDLADKIHRIRNIFMRYQDLKERKGRKIKKILYPSWLRVYLCFFSKPITMRGGVEFIEHGGKFLRAVYAD